MKSEYQLRKLLEKSIYCFNNHGIDKPKVPYSSYQYIELLEWILEINLEQHEHIDRILEYQIKKGRR